MKLKPGQVIKGSTRPCCVRWKGSTIASINTSRDDEEVRCWRYPRHRLHLCKRAGCNGYRVAVEIRVIGPIKPRAKGEEARP